MFLLRVSLIGFGLVFCSVYWLFQLDPFGGWAWTPSQSEYQVMIVGIYMVLGLMMIFQASRDPLKHVLFIRFVIYSSVVHALIMFVQVLMDSTELGHFLGDIPALIIAALVLQVLLQKQLAQSQDDMN